MHWAADNSSSHSSSFLFSEKNGFCLPLFCFLMNITSCVIFQDSVGLGTSGYPWVCLHLQERRKITIGFQLLPCNRTYATDKVFPSLFLHGFCTFTGVLSVCSPKQSRVLLCPSPQPAQNLQCIVTLQECAKVSHQHLQKENKDPVCTPDLLGSVRSFMLARRWVSIDDKLSVYCVWITHDHTKIKGRH